MKDLSFDDVPGSAMKMKDLWAAVSRKKWRRGRSLQDACECTTE